MSQSHTSHTHTADSYQLEGSTWTSGRNILMFVALVGIVGSLAGYFTDPERFFRSYLIAFAFTSLIGLGAFFFVMVQFLTGSAWSVTMRRIMENLMSTLPFGLILFVPIAFGLRHLYPWMDPAVVAASEALKAKAGFLEPNFFLVRTVVYFVLWSIWIFAIYRQSTKQDTTHSVQQMHIASKWSAPGLFLAVVVGSIASIDWIMSVEPAWYSTIFGMISLAGGSLAFFSVVTLICLGFRRSGILTNSITKEHYHDLGKWLFALTAFYTYVAFSQYILMWYSNQPEETVWYRHRMVGPWFYISLAMPFLRFLIPFFALLCRPAKRSLSMIGFFAVWSLIVEYIDLYWVVMPVYYPKGPQPHWLDLTTLAATVGVCGLVFWYRMKQHAIVPVGDLRLEQSLHFENAYEESMSHSDEAYEHPIEHHDPAEGFDRNDPEVAKIFVFTVVSLIVLVLVIFAITQYFEDIYAKAVSEKILTAPSEQLRDVRNRDAWNLAHYMYGDHSEKSGRVRIPLDKAIELNLQDAEAGKTFYPAKPAAVKPYSPPPAVPKYY